MGGYIPVPAYEDDFENLHKEFLIMAPAELFNGVRVW